MIRRSILSATLVSIVVVLAACGDPNQPSAATDPTTTPATVPASIAHPTGAEDVVLQIAYEGGLVPVGFDFASVPALLVSGEGRVFTQAILPTVYPGPLLPAIMVRSITEDGMQALIGVAQRAGLLATPPDYSSGPSGSNVADAPNTVLVINAQGATFTHSAYALGIGDPGTPARKALLDAVTNLTNIDATAGSANLGTDQPFVATAYRLRARVINPADLTSQDPPPTIVDWPSGAGVSLSGATECARVDAAAVGATLIDAKQNTYFKEGDVVYQLAVRGVLPGDPAC